MRPAALLLLAAAGACTSDSSKDDDDGTTPPTDPSLDTDGDGLTDLVEHTLGTDPDDVDTDDDGYTDRDEDHEQTDPLDATSVIYEGGWPYYYGKTALSGGTVYGVGERFGNFTFPDQFGNDVALWDFYGDTRPVIVELGGGWCLACNNMAEWLAGEDDPNYAPYNDVRDAVAGGSFVWITVMGEDYVVGTPAKPSTVEQWVATYPNDRVPVLLDTTYTTALFVDATVWPMVTLLAPDLTVLSVTTVEDGYLPVLADAVTAANAP